MVDKVLTCRKMVFDTRDYPAEPCGRKAKYIIRQTNGDLPVCARHATWFKKRNQPYRVVS